MSKVDVAGLAEIWFTVNGAWFDDQEDALESWLRTKLPKLNDDEIAKAARRVRVQIKRLGGKR